MQDSEEAVPADTGPETGLRERKKRATRAALVEAASRLVASQGYEGVTVEGICAAAGVSTRTFFNYFATKDDAVLALRPWGADDPSAQVFASGGPSGDDATDLDVFVRAILDDWGHDIRYLAAAIRLAREYPHLLARRVAVVEAHRGTMAELFARRAGRNEPDVTDEVGAIAVGAQIRAAILAWESAPETTLPRDHLPAARDRLRRLLAEPRPG